MSEPVDELVDGFTRLRLDFGYDGTDFYGWSKQPDLRTIQGEFIKAFTLIFGEDENDFGFRVAGRTDAGVHGLMQVVHFDTDIQRDPYSWVRGTNRFLPDDIAVQWAQYVPDSFHCRASATGRRYVYVLLDSPVRPSLEAGRVGGPQGGRRRPGDRALAAEVPGAGPAPDHHVGRKGSAGLGFRGPGPAVASGDAGRVTAILLGLHCSLEFLR